MFPTHSSSTNKLSQTITQDNTSDLPVEMPIDHGDTLWVSLFDRPLKILLQYAEILDILTILNSSSSTQFVKEIWLHQQTHEKRNKLESYYIDCFLLHFRKKIFNICHVIFVKLG